MQSGREVTDSATRELASGARHPHVQGMKLELIVRRTNHPPLPWSWELLDSSCAPIQRSRQTFSTRDLARAEGEKVLAAHRTAAGSGKPPA